MTFTKKMSKTFHCYSSVPHVLLSSAQLRLLLRSADNALRAISIQYFALVTSLFFTVGEGWDCFVTKMLCNYLFISKLQPTDPSEIAMMYFCKISSFKNLLQRFESSFNNKNIVSSHHIINKILASLLNFVRKQVRIDVLVLFSFI